MPNKGLVPFKQIPRAMMRAAIEKANKALNQFSATNCVSDTWSPLTIMTGRPNPNYNDMKIKFGAYAQVYKDNKPMNTQRVRTTGAITLTPTGNAQGGYHFLSLTTGRKLSRQQWDELPTPGGVVEAVKRIAQTDNQPLIGHGVPLFEWSPGVPIQDNVQAPILQDNNGDLQVFEQQDEGEEEDKGADEILFGGEEPGHAEDSEDDVDAERGKQDPED
jgi:hypothetical protein